MEIINMAVKLIKVQAGEVNEHANKAGEEADRACELANAIEIAQSREYKNRKLAKIEKVKSRIEAAAANTAYKFALESHSEAQMALVIAEQIRDIALERDSEVEDVQILEEVKAEYKKALEYKEKSADNVERARIYAQKATMLSERNFKYIVASPIAEEKVTEQRICVEQ
jgi:hypothetical protein